MRNATELSNGQIVTVDNAGCIGLKPLDEVQCPNEVAAYYTARTSLLEQLCAGSLPELVLLSNFTGEHAWQEYVNGIERVFKEANLPIPKIVGSTESNFESKQSGFSIAMIGNREFKVNSNCKYWFIAGKPLVGNELLQNPSKCVPSKWLIEQLQQSKIQYIHPVGSKGLQAEFEKLFSTIPQTEIDTKKSSGPSTCVIIGSNQSTLKGYEFIERII